MTYPTDYINKIICGDCLEIMKDIPNKSKVGRYLKMAWWTPPRLAVNLYFTARLQSIKRPFEMEVE